MKKSDLRKSRTRAIFNQALLQLLTEKPLSSITVKDLIVRAELNRSTFYLHYLDMPDFIETTLTEALNTLQAQLIKLSPLDSGKLYAYYNTYLVWFDEYRILLQALQGAGYESALWKNLDQINSSHLDNITAHHKMHTLYVSTADRGLFKEWLLNRHEHSLEALAQLLAQNSAKILNLD